MSAIMSLFIVQYLATGKIFREGNQKIIQVSIPALKMEGQKIVVTNQKEGLALLSSPDPPRA